MNQNNLYKLAIFDIDGTIIKGQSQKMLLRYAFHKGYISYSFYSYVILWFLLYKIGILSSVSNVLQSAIGFSKDKSVNEIDKLVRNCFTEKISSYIYKDVSDLIRSYLLNGTKVVLVSSAIEPIVKQFSEYFQGTEYKGTTMEVFNNIYTGHIAGPILYGFEKVKYIENIIKSGNYKKEDVIAYADHKTDLPIFDIVGKGVLINPDVSLRRYCLKENIDIMYVN